MGSCKVVLDRSILNYLKSILLLLMTEYEMLNFVLDCCLNCGTVKSYRVFFEIHFMLHKNLWSFFLHNVPDCSILDGDDDEEDNTTPEQERLLTTPSQSRQQLYGTGMRFDGSYKV